VDCTDAMDTRIEHELSRITRCFVKSVTNKKEAVKKQPLILVESI